jgi:hypothetical protein
MMARYASETSVSVEKNSRNEIERTLKRYGAQSFAYGTEGRRATIGFRIADRLIRFNLILPDPANKEFTEHSRGLRTAEAAEKAWEQACRQRWRALALVIKAKLEAVAAGITTVEDEFLAHTMLPDGSTFGQWAAPQMQAMIENRQMPSQLMIAGSVQ